MAEKDNDSAETGNRRLETYVAQIGDPKLLELIFNIVQDAQAAGSVVQIVTIWPAGGGGNAGGGLQPTKCSPTGACPK